MSVTLDDSLFPCEILAGNYCLGKYKISTLCLQSMPCQHFVTIQEEDERTQTLRGDTIYRMLEKEGLSHPHFDAYKNWEGWQSLSQQEKDEALKKQEEKRRSVPAAPSMEQFQSWLEITAERKQQDLELKRSQTNPAGRRLEKLKLKCSTTTTNT